MTFLKPFYFLIFFLCLGLFFNFSFINLLVSFFILYFSFFVGFGHSIVMSVLSLIALAATFSFTLFGYGASFLAVLYLAVYIGAVAVFFLFVVMMTDLSDEDSLKSKPIERPNFLFILICFFLAAFFNFLLVKLMFVDNVKSLLSWEFSFNGPILLDSFNLLNFDSNIEMLAKLLFKQNVASFIILSIVILVALVGAILLTSSINLVDKHELMFSGLDNLNSIWEDDRLSSFGDGKPQDMDIQLARTTQSSVNLVRARYF